MSVVCSVQYNDVITARDEHKAALAIHSYPARVITGTPSRHNFTFADIDVRGTKGPKGWQAVFSLLTNLRTEFVEPKRRDGRLCPTWKNHIAYALRCRLAPSSVVQIPAVLSDRAATGHRL